MVVEFGRYVLLIIILFSVIGISESKADSSLVYKRTWIRKP